MTEEKLCNDFEKLLIVFKNNKKKKIFLENEKKLKQKSSKFLRKIFDPLIVVLGLYSNLVSNIYH